MIENTILRNKIDSIFNKIRNQKSDAWNLNIHRWDWSCGVGLYGLLKAFEATGDEKYIHFIRQWFDQNGPNHAFGSVNNVAPANAVLLLAENSEDPQYEKVCQAYADWCTKTALRTSNDGLAHVWEGGDEDYKNQLWIDTMFMAGIYLLKYGRYKNDPAIIEEALHQYGLHMGCLLDPQSELFYHAYHCVNKTFLGEHWGRGNGWMVVSLVELLQTLKDSAYDLDRTISVFKRVMEKAYSLRLESGMLRTLLLVEESYPETTCTALFGYAAWKGYTLGILDERFLEWGKTIGETIADFVSEDGNILFCSYGTNPESKEIYMTRPCDQSLYADGIVMMLLSLSL